VRGYDSRSRKRRLPEVNRFADVGFNGCRDIPTPNIDSLAAAMPEKVSELKAKWSAWDQKNEPALWGEGATDNDGPEPGGAEEKPGKKRNK